MRKTRFCRLSKKRLRSIKLPEAGAGQTRIIDLPMDVLAIIIDMAGAWNILRYSRSKGFTCVAMTLAMTCKTLHSATRSWKEGCESQPRPTTVAIQLMSMYAESSILVRVRHYQEWAKPLPNTPSTLVPFTNRFFSLLSWQPVQPDGMGSYHPSTTGVKAYLQGHHDS